MAGRGQSGGHFQLSTSKPTTTANMKPLVRPCVAALATFACFNLHAEGTDWLAGMKEGKPEFKSISQLAFGPEGILFVADTKAAAVVAIATGDTKPAAGAAAHKVEGLDKKIAGLLGTAPDQILIDDMAVNPVSRNVYLAVSRGRGPDAVPVLIRVKPGGALEVVSLDKVKSFPRRTAGCAGRRRRRRRPPAEQSAAGIHHRHRVSSKTACSSPACRTKNSPRRCAPFRSRSRTWPGGTSVEIYHGAHGKFETRSPVRTFVPFNVGNEPSLLAAYTCTPLVQFPITELKPGAKIKGKTIAELGNRNRPLDMIVYQKDGKDFLLLANSSRGVMKISTDNIENAESIESPVGGGGAKGLPYETIKDWTGIDQLDKLDQGHAVVVRRGDGNSLNLETVALP